MNEVKLKIRGSTWTVKTADNMFDYYGVTDQDSKTITIASKLKKEEFMSTALHEFLHAVFPYLHEDVITKAEADIWRAMRKIENEYDKATDIKAS